MLNENPASTPMSEQASLDVVARAEEVSEALFEGAGRADADACFPASAVDRLRGARLLMAPFPPAMGGAGLVAPDNAIRLFEVLRRVGGGDLSVGRLYEGHVNAVALVVRYGTKAQLAGFADAVRAGAISGVWNAEGEAIGAVLVRTDGRLRLEGRKILASGAGSLTRPLVTATVEGAVWMTMPEMQRGERADLSRWTAQGMRSTATGTVDLTGLAIGPADVIGGADDYKRQPAFFGGAWRFCAVQLGAIERLVDLFRSHLVALRRGDDPYQRARVAECLGAARTAAFWVEEAAALVAAERGSAEAIVAFAGLTRGVVERAALDVLERVHRGVGLASFISPNPIERVSRDLATYLRQPAPDGAAADAAGFVLASDVPTRDLWPRP